jgi:tetratricopeptide (TPR) repeat protein
VPKITNKWASGCSRSVLSTGQSFALARKPLTTQSPQEAQPPVAPASTGAAMRLPLNVFVSYAHEDEPHRESLARHLSALEDEGLIRLWHDRKITPGREWAGAIDGALADAQIVLLLISADFLASDYCNDNELTEAIRLNDAGHARVVPVILRSCDWERSRFACFNALPADGAPVVEAEHPDQRFKAVAKGLRAMISELTATTDASVSPVKTRATKLLTTAMPPAATPRRTLRINKLSLLGIEFGPFELPLPRAGGKQLALGLLLAAVASIWALWAWFIAPPLEQAARAMRMSHYERALQQTNQVPRWLAAWPELRSIGEQAQLGISLYQAPQDWQAIGLELERQLKARPRDADLLVIKAQYLLHRREDYDQARSLAQSALESDPQHAEAWFLLGLDYDLNGKLEDAIVHYRQAVEIAPDSPPYRNNLAHALLELGRYEEALSEYRLIIQFPLARVEQALALWALGRLDEAAESQRQALAMLGDTALMGSFFNRRSWMFTLSKQGVRLPVVEEKRCYARLGEAASRRLAGEMDAEGFPPPGCAFPHLKALVADDLCRYVEAVQPSLALTAQRLRQMLGQTGSCPGAHPER